MTNRIGGDFNQEAIEAFRAAYADQMRRPEDDDIDAFSGLPTDTVSNTSPWIEHTGLWKYPSGKGPDEDLHSPFFPDDYITSDDEDDDDEDLDGFIDQFDDDDYDMTDEEIENLLAELREASSSG
jgi:hypothetical protein